MTHPERRARTRSRRASWTGFALAALLTAGCAAVGPDYVPPDISAPEAWNRDMAGGLRASPASAETLARWWTVLNDPVLNRLMDRAAAGNPDLKEAMARVREARARRGTARAGLFPTADASASARKSYADRSGESELYSAGFDAGWELDIFGGTRRSLEAARADADAAEAAAEDAMVSLMAEVARNYVEARTFQTRLRLAEANIAAQSETFDLTRSRNEAGLGDELAVQQARYNLESSRSQLPTLRTGLEEARNRLAVLLGERPGAVHALLAASRPIPVVPPAVAVGVPAETLRNRPDVRAAERNLAAQTARIGEATAELYPKFRLTGSIGLESVSAGDLLDAASRVWSLGPGVSWNLFDAGAIRRNIEVRNALQEQALIQYESAILTALEEVENALTAYAEEQIRRDRLEIARAAARDAEALAQAQYRAGMVDFSNVLDAQRSLLGFEDQLAGSEGAVAANLVRLYKALGGGWQSMAEAGGAAVSRSGGVSGKSAVTVGEMEVR